MTFLILFRLATGQTLSIFLLPDDLMVSALMVQHVPEYGGYSPS